MIATIYRILFVLVVLQQIFIYANHIRHHHGSSSSSSNGHSHGNHHRSRLEHKYNLDEYVNYDFGDNVKNGHADAEDMNYDDDDYYYEYMNDLANHEEEVAVSVPKRSNSDSYDYRGNEKEKYKDYDYQGDEGDHKSFYYKSDEARGQWQTNERSRRRSVPSNYYNNLDNIRKVNDDKSKLGTREGAQNEFNELRNDFRKSKVNNYNQYILREWGCKIPRPKLIHVENKPGSSLTPHCVVLHRCGSDTGCCNETSTCTSVKTELVNISLLESMMVRERGTRDKGQQIVILQFLNHTECGCQSKEVCKCPTNFVAIKKSKDKCACECRSQDAICIAQREGKRQFSLSDQDHIRNGAYSLPQCSRGHYSEVEGSCPQYEM